MAKKETENTGKITHTQIKGEEREIRRVSGVGVCAGEIKLPHVTKTKRTETQNGKF